MLWPMQGLFRFVTGPDVLSSLKGWRLREQIDSGSDTSTGVTQRLMVLAGEHDVLATPTISLDAARRYDTAFWELVKGKKIDGISEDDVRKGKEQGAEWDGVRFKVVPGVAHHLQNHVEWERGAKELLAWIEQL